MPIVFNLRVDDEIIHIFIAKNAAIANRPFASLTARFMLPLSAITPTMMTTIATIAPATAILTICQVFMPRGRGGIAGGWYGDGAYAAGGICEGLLLPALFVCLFVCYSYPLPLGYRLVIL